MRRKRLKPLEANFVISFFCNKYDFQVPATQRNLKVVASILLRYSSVDPCSMLNFIENIQARKWNKFESYTKFSKTRSHASLCHVSRLQPDTSLAYVAQPASLGFAAQNLAHWLRKGYFAQYLRFRLSWSWKLTLLKEMKVNIRFNFSIYIKLG